MMDNWKFNKLSEEINDGNGYELTSEEKYEFMEEVSKRIGLSLFEAFLIENTVDYSKVYAENYDKKEVINHVIEGYYDAPNVDDIETCSWEICQDLGYEIEY